MSSRQRSDDRRQMTEGNYKVSGVRFQVSGRTGQRTEGLDFRLRISNFGLIKRSRNQRHWKSECGMWNFGRQTTEDIGQKVRG